MYVKLYKWTNELKAIIKLHDNDFLVQIKQKITILPQIKRISIWLVESKFKLFMIERTLLE